MNHLRLIGFFCGLGLCVAGCASSAEQPVKEDASDIVVAVKAAAAKDCGCGKCSASGCEPCHGKNCYFCVAKGLVTSECGCGNCSPKGCKCGPGCDVVKFHLAPVEAQKAGRPDSLGKAQDKQDKMKEDFEKENSKWKFAEGTWARRKSGDSQVLAQTATVDPWAVAILEDKKVGDVDISVKFRPISGKEDASGGLIFRAKDSKNYYVVRANGLEDNFRLYTMIDGSRSTLKSAKVDPPKLGDWHTIRVVAKGDKIQAYLNGKLLIEHSDKTFTEGYLGLWTKADSVTEFDDLEASEAK